MSHGGVTVALKTRVLVPTLATTESVVEWAVESSTRVIGMSTLFQTTDSTGIPHWKGLFNVLSKVRTMLFVVGAGGGGGGGGVGSETEVRHPDVIVTFSSVFS